MRVGPVDVKEAYATFNMGAGFAAYVDSSHAQKCVEIATALGHDAWIAGEVKKQGDRKAVEIVPLDLTFDEQSLKLR
jgi:phosphoribosylformylglycinamidine cyclo-ligase